MTLWFLPVQCKTFNSVLAFSTQCNPCSPQTWKEMALLLVRQQPQLLWAIRANELQISENSKSSKDLKCISTSSLWDAASMVIKCLSLAGRSKGSLEGAGASPSLCSRFAWCFHCYKHGHLVFPKLCQERQCQGFPGGWACLRQLKGSSTRHTNFPNTTCCMSWWNSTWG